MRTTQNEKRGIDYGVNKLEKSISHIYNSYFSKPSAIWFASCKT
jgi:hypothetical protein